jgi:DNA-binding MarR family transcriptional regulator
MSSPADNGSKRWTFLTNHTQVLLCISREDDVRLRDIAERVGITERAAQRIVADLVAAGFVERKRIGRQNHYSVDRSAKMRHPAQANQAIGDLLDLLTATDSAQAGEPDGAPAPR